MELNQCLEIIETVKSKGIANGIEVMKNQVHSGMSWGLMKSRFHGVNRWIKYGTQRE